MPFLTVSLTAFVIFFADKWRLLLLLLLFRLLYCHRLILVTAAGGTVSVCTESHCRPSPVRLCWRHIRDQSVLVLADVCAQRCQRLFPTDLFSRF